jgi:hypothetical protein
MMMSMTTYEASAGASDGSDWYDTTPIESDERERKRRVDAARQHIDAGVEDGRLPETGNGWHPAAEAKSDIDRIGRVMRSTIAGPGPGLADLPPADIIAALQLIRPARESLDRLESNVMASARQQWMSWRVIAEALGLLSPQAAAQRWERLTGTVAPAVWALRQRVVAALQEGTVTRAEAKVFVGGSEGRTVVLQLSAHGPTETRRNVAERLIEALRAAGLGITDEGSHSLTDMAAYLADGGTAEVYELAERSTTSA